MNRMSTYRIQYLYLGDQTHEAFWKLNQNAFQPAFQQPCTFACKIISAQFEKVVSSNDKEKDKLTKCVELWKEIKLGGRISSPLLQAIISIYRWVYIKGVNLLWSRLIKSSQLSGYWCMLTWSKGYGLQLILVMVEICAIPIEIILTIYTGLQ
jgi:hypothetical protein